MTVKRIVANIESSDPAEALRFYRDILGLELVMNHGWIRTLAGEAGARAQISFATEGGSGTPVPDLSIEVDDVDAVHDAMREAGFAITYAIVDEPWGVRRFFVRDPFGRLVNILAHS